MELERWIPLSGHRSRLPSWISMMLCEFMHGIPETQLATMLDMGKGKIPQFGVVTP